MEAIAMLICLFLGIQPFPEARPLTVPATAITAIPDYADRIAFLGGVFDECLYLEADREPGDDRAGYLAALAEQDRFIRARQLGSLAFIERFMTPARQPLQAYVDRLYLTLRKAVRSRAMLARAGPGLPPRIVEAWRRRIRADFYQAVVDAGSLRHGR